MSGLAGPLKHFRYGKINGFRCRIGHTYSTESVLTAHAEREEAALWHAVVAGEEAADLAKELAGAVQAKFSTSLRQEAVAKRTLVKSIRATLDALPRVTAVTERERPRVARRNAGRKVRAIRAAS